MVRVELESEILKINNNITENSVQFDYVDYKEVTYSDFFKRYILNNKPCVIRGVTKGWKCQDDWVLDSFPNFATISSEYGDSEIPTADCNEKYFNSHPRGKMKLFDYLTYWKSYISSGYSATLPRLYLKDWHCFKEHPDKSHYNVPDYFVSDWLNEYYLSFPELKDDYRFVYMGPKGTWTPLHKDVFSSFSWSVNLCGKKDWVFYPPSEMACITDKFGNLAFDVTTDVDNHEFPELCKARCCSLEQGPGDAVFVPSGWYHQVWNRADTISVNHNWINGCNVHLMLSSLLLELKNVEKELADCEGSEEWHSDCQRLLKATFGLDLEQFLHFINFIAGKRIISCESDDDLNLPCGNSIGPNHIKFDLKSILDVLKKLSTLGYPCIRTDYINSLLEKVNKILDFG